MKANIHPKWNHQAIVTCACGSTFTTGSQQDELHVDICSQCHPFFTGEMRFVDRQGRVDKFLQRQANAQQRKATQSKKKAVEAVKPVEEVPVSPTGAPLSYKEILQLEQNKLKTIAKQRVQKAA